MGYAINVGNPRIYSKDGSIAHSNILIPVISGLLAGIVKKDWRIDWFAARLKIAGGSVRNTDKGLIAISPSKAEFPFVIWDARGEKLH